MHAHFFSMLTGILGGVECQDEHATSIGAVDLVRNERRQQRTVHGDANGANLSTAVDRIGLRIQQHEKDKSNFDVGHRGKKIVLQTHKRLGTFI